MKIKNHMDQARYEQHVKDTMPKSNLLSECLRAFLVGGLICVLGQGIRNFAIDILQLSEEMTSGFTSMVLIFLGAFFTGVGVYDVLGKFAGAGSIVPITGFANSIVSPAIDAKTEGYILGVGAKLFTIAGPVLVYGISASVLAGIIYYLVPLIFGGV